MVISYYGALQAFLAIYNNLPGPVYAFIHMALLVFGGVSLLNWFNSR